MRVALKQWAASDRIHLMPWHWLFHFASLSCFPGCTHFVFYFGNSLQRLTTELKNRNSFTRSLPHKNSRVRDDPSEKRLNNENCCVDQNPHDGKVNISLLTGWAASSIGFHCFVSTPLFCWSNREVVNYEGCSFVRGLPPNFCKVSCFRSLQATIARSPRSV